MLNLHFKNLSSEYIFPIIEAKLAEVQKAHPKKTIINLGVGDIRLPLAPAIARAICEGVESMGEKARGYGPSEGYPFLRELIAKQDYQKYGITAEEIFLSDGTNSDVGGIQELFAAGCKVGIANPTYPVYRDASLIAGKEIVYLPCNKSTGFVPIPPDEKLDLVYLCTPNNPTGVAMTSRQLEQWISWARSSGAFLIVDAVYQAFITSEEVPQSIYALEDAHEVAIELKSFSKSAGFTGLRCGYSVVPKALLGGKLHAMWKRRVDAKSNGVSYPIQCGAAAVFSPEGKRETGAQIALYQEGGQKMLQGLKALGFEVYGGCDCPYIWWKIPSEFTSWEFFEKLLAECLILAIAGSGFGSEGEGYIRLSTFITKPVAEEALYRLKKMNSCVT